MFIDRGLVKFVSTLKNQIYNHLYIILLGSWRCLRNWYFGRRGMLPQVHLYHKENHTPVDSYWARHTVGSRPFVSRAQSITYLKRRSSEHPPIKELMQLYRDHSGKILLDYGCGPGNDLIGFALYSHAKRLIGIDISKKSLHLAGYRLALHRIDPKEVELINISDAFSKIPLDDSSVDYINCSGVLHHVSDPALILREFYRVLKPGSRACIMVYNYNSIYLHLVVAYVRMILDGEFRGQSVREAFSKNTDGRDCPISRCYRPEEFIEICGNVNFKDVDYAGGYFWNYVLKLFKRYNRIALEDDRLSIEHKNFLKGLKQDDQGFLTHQGKYAGVGGVYWLTKS
ncbi:MAG: class I SAM-dependent methyltransferase [Candidatus Omnitrophica bacterium]|nr:class I SAM-dependent methyltransferase [Candidatus Omnitrophota bacterium]